MLKTFRALLVILFFAAVNLLAAETSMACICEEQFTPPCAAYWRADAVFIGKVRSIESRERIGISPTGFARVQVEKAFKGIGIGEISVDYFEGDCGIVLAPDQKYLFYAYPGFQINGFRLKLCSPSKTIADATADLEYISQLLTNKKGLESISGNIGFIRGLAGSRVIVRGPDGSIDSLIDDIGSYRVKVRGAGTYHVQAFLPVGFEVYAPGDVNITKTPSGIIVEYSAVLRENECNHKEMGIGRTEKAKSRTHITRVISQRK